MVASSFFCVPDSTLHLISSLPTLTVSSPASFALNSSKTASRFAFFTLARYVSFVGAGELRHLVIGGGGAGLVAGPELVLGVGDHLVFVVLGTGRCDQRQEES